MTNNDKMILVRLGVVMEEQMNTYYDPEKRRAPWLRIVIIILVSLIL